MRRLFGKNVIILALLFVYLVFGACGKDNQKSEDQKEEKKQTKVEKKLSKIEKKFQKKH